MSPADIAWRAATRREAVIAAVEGRLAAAGAVSELRCMQGLSAQEMDVLIHREVHEPGIHRDIHSKYAERSQPRAEVAA